MAPSHDEDAWHTLVYVCRRWRYVVFDSPRRLDLRLLCTNLNGRLTKTLDIWPELPIVICVYYGQLIRPPNVPDVVSAFKRRGRVCKISIDSIPNSLLKEVAAMTEPFPALIELELSSFEEDPPTLPDSFLGGSFPRLQLCLSHQLCKSSSGDNTEKSYQRYKTFSLRVSSRRVQFRKVLRISLLWASSLVAL